MIQQIFELQNPWRKEAGYVFSFRHREILPILIDNLPNKKILGLVGSRQVGKSSLLYLLIKQLLDTGIAAQNIFYFNLDDLKLHELFESVYEFMQFVGNRATQSFVIIDEIQRLKTPGLFLKELFDLNLNVKVIYSGSSQLEIKSKLKEHLVGRARQFEIQRLSFDEYCDFSAPITRKQALEQMMIFGSYPAVALESNKNEKKMSIKDIYQSYVEKDIVDFLRVKNPDAFNRLLILLANQIGNLLNIDGLSKSLRISREETIKYLDMLEGTFIIKRIYPFHKNYKKEIVKTPKVYFLDLGLSNYVINNFNDLTLRNDQGALFENWYFLELLSSDHYSMNKINYWRTTNQTEIDFIISEEGKTRAIEVKWGNRGVPKSFNTIKKYYPGIHTELIMRDNFL